ncbi:MAG TPA: hypothetical protein DCR27_02720 [Lachnospiraceae bacterium]|nr:hypothetical protein [Lachnospiraceae bacterium]
MIVKNVPKKIHKNTVFSLFSSFAGNGFNAYFYNVCFESRFLYIFPTTVKQTFALFPIFFNLRPAFLAQ